MWKDQDALEHSVSGIHVHHVGGAGVCCLARDEMQQMHMKVVERDTKERWKGMD